MEAERYQQIVAGLTQTNNQLVTQLRELEAPAAHYADFFVIPRGGSTSLAVPGLYGRGNAPCSPSLRSRQVRRTWMPVFPPPLGSITMVGGFQDRRKELGARAARGGQVEEQAWV